MSLTVFSVCVPACVIWCCSGYCSAAIVALVVLNDHNVEVVGCSLSIRILSPQSSLLK